MAFYSYKCDSCDHEFDMQLSMSESDKPLGEPCPECKEEGHVIRVFKPVPIHGEYAKVDSGFKDTMNRIKKNNIHSTMPDY